MKIRSLLRKFAAERVQLRPFTCLVAGTLCPLMSPMSASAYTVTTSSDLWSTYQANPDDHSHLANVSYAGYKQGEVPIPNVPTVVTVTDYGAAGDGSTDDSAAFREAIHAAHEAGGGAVYVPAGNYSLSDPVWLRYSGVSLKGAGMGQTILTFTRPLLDSVGQNNPNSTNIWSWTGGLVWVGPNDATVFPENQEDSELNVNGLLKQGYSSSSNPWEYWRIQNLVTNVTDFNPRGDDTLTVDDASGLQPGELILLTYDNTAGYDLFHELCDHPLFDSWSDSNWGNWFEPANYPQWIWAVQIESINGNEVKLAQPLRVSTQSVYNVAIHRNGRYVEEIGIEDLSIQLNGYVDGNPYDAGWNGLFLHRAFNCWVRNVEVLDGNNGFHVSSSKNCSLLNTAVRGDRYVHHPYTNRCMSGDILYENFETDISEDSKGGTHGLNSEFLSSGNVWSKGTMNRGTFDTHRGLPFDMVRTEITLRNEKNSNPGGASKAGAYAAQRMSHWNVTISGSDRQPDTSGDYSGVDTTGLYVYQPENHVFGALVGIKGAPLAPHPCWNSESCNVMPCGDKNVLVADEGQTPTPANLYDAQVNFRKNTQKWIHLAEPNTDFVRQGDTVQLIASANAGSNNISEVGFYVNGVSIHVDNTAPYTYNWSPDPGVYEIELEMKDSSGVTTWTNIPRTIGVGQIIPLDEDHPDVNLVGNWDRGPSIEEYWLGGKAAYTFDDNEYAEFTFQGTRFLFYSSAMSTHSVKFDLFINGSLIAENESVRNIGGVRYLAYDSGWMPNDIYTVKIQCQDRLLFDRVLVYSTDGSQPTNHAPVAVDDNVTTGEGVAVEISVLVNDTDEDNDSLSIESYSQPSNGTVTQSGNNLIYTPDMGYTGGDSFTYVVTDGARSDSGSVSITVNGVVGSGAFEQDGGTDGIVSIEAENYDQMISRSSHDWIARTDFGTASGGTCMRAEPDTGLLVNTGFSETSPELHYEVNFVKTGTHYIWIRGYKTGGNDDSLHVGLNGEEVSTSDRLNITTNGSDFGWSRETMDNSYATIEITTAGVHTLNVWMREDGARLDKIVLTTSSTYTPSGTGPTESPRDEPANQPPVAVDDNAVTEEDSSVEISVLVNDTDEDNDSLSIESYSQPSNGTVTQSGNNLIYTPDMGFFGSDSFTYIVTDGTDSDSGSVSVTVNEVVGSGAFEQDGGTDGIVSIEAENYDQMISRSSHEWIARTDFGTASGGACMRAEPDTGLLVNTGFSETSPELQYEVNFVKTGTHYIWIRGYKTGGNDDSLHVGLNGEEVSTSDRLNITTNGSDFGWSRETMDNSYATIEITTAGVHTLNVWMREDGARLDKIVLTTSSSYTPSGTGPTESPRDEPANQPPVAMNDNASVNEGQNVVIAVLANDTDEDNDALNIESFTQPSDGSVTKVGDELQYSAPWGYGGNANFNYSVSDGMDIDTGSVSIVVSNLAPLPPAGLSVTGTSSSSISLGWSDSTEGDLVGYNVYRSSTSGGTYTEVATLVASSEYTDSALSADTTYYYVVTAEDGAGNESGYLIEVSATTNGTNVGGSIDFSGVTFHSYTSSQDSATSTATVVSGGAGVSLSGNVWKFIEYPYTITENTILEVTVSTVDAGELIGIGLDNDNDYENTINGSPTLFILGGSQGVPSSMIDLKSSYTPPGPVTVQIPVGQYYTGAMDRLAFCGDDDNDSSTDVTFESIVIYEVEEWISTDIGAVGATGSSSYDSGTDTFTINGSGADIWSSADEFHFVYRETSGDATLIAHVKSVENTNSWAKAGVMIRDALSNSSVHAMMVITPGNGAVFQNRTTDGGSSSSIKQSGINAPYWVRIERAGDTFTGSISQDGSSWTEVGSTTIAMSDPVHIGMAVTSHNDGTICTAEMSQVTTSVGSNPQGEYSVLSSSYLGGSTDDIVVSSAIQSDGTVVLAGTFSGSSFGGVLPSLLNGADSSDQGVVLQLASDGKTVLKASRVATAINEMVIDGNDNIIVAAGADGLLKINSSLSSVVWTKNENPAYRVDVGTNNDVAVLAGTGFDSGSIAVYSSSGTSLGNFGGFQKTNDICLNSSNGHVYMIGFENKHSGCNPVQVAYLRAVQYDGTEIWRNFDWPGTLLDDCDGDGLANNMADTRGYRIFYKSGTLYALFESAGGNDILRWHPNDLNTSVPLQEYDQYNQFYNSQSEHKTTIISYDAATGDHLIGTRLTARLQDGSANACRIKDGNIAVDDAGLIYVSGNSGSGGGTNNTALGLPFTFNPLPSDVYGGGAFLMIMPPEMNERLYLGRVTGDSSSNTALAVRQVDSSGNPTFVIGGSTSGDNKVVYTFDPVEPSPNGQKDGFFALFGN